MQAEEKQPTLGELVRRRIDAAYGGNQRAFARATGITPQSVYALVHDKVQLPQPHARRVLARELGLTHVRLLVLAGELTEDEAAGIADQPAGELDRIVAALDDEQRQKVAVIVQGIADAIEAQPRRRTEPRPDQEPAPAPARNSNPGGRR